MSFIDRFNKEVWDEEKSGSSVDLLLGNAEDIVHDADKEIEKLKEEIKTLKERNEKLNEAYSNASWTIENYRNSI